jgi:putative hydrolase of the HAD superfamily
VLTPRVPELVGAFSRRTGIPVEALVAATVAVAAGHGTQDPLEPLEASLVTEEQWGAEVERELLERFGLASDLSDFARRWLAPHAPDATWHAQLTRMRDAGHQIGLLSNMMPSFEPHWRALAPPSLFDHVVLSFEVGLRKPDPAIFALAAKRAAAAPGDCVLVDDLAPNCDAARATGWRAVLATTPAATVAALDSLLGAMA